MNKQQGNYTVAEMNQNNKLEYLFFFLMFGISLNPFAKSPYYFLMMQVSKMSAKKKK